MAQEEDKGEVKRLCELASEQDGEKLIVLTMKIITLPDAKHASSARCPSLTSKAPSLSSNGI